MRRPPIPGLVLGDGWLQPYTREIRTRMKLFDLATARLVKKFGSLENCSRGYERMGFNRRKDTREWVYREWAPGARELFLIGDFNGWDRSATPLRRDSNGIWSVTLPPDALKHGDRVKVHVVGADLEGRDRIPAWIRRAVQDPITHDFCGEIQDVEPYEWKNTRFSLENMGTPYIYEAHAGMAGEEERVHGFREFADNVLPRIAKQGYNIVQLMAVQEHPYYGSFGYHVSSFFAPSSRFGTPEDLKYLIDIAHGMGIAVLLDIVHSHAVKNVAEGLNNFDGSGGQYFHSGVRGIHPDWDSCCFDYGRDEVIEFLLSNVRWWLEEYHFDGFRFDGVTSMLYYHRGHGAFTDLGMYFNTQVDHEAVTYLQLAATLIQQVKPGAYAIAEDMSGMPGLCRPVDEGGFGFTHRLAMGIPDFWIKILKEKKDEDWGMGEIWYTLTNRRYGEPNVAYCESHDQALVGDKTLAFRLMDAEMYWKMETSQQSLIIDRGMALHKMIRLITLSVGGEGWLNFMGNEFGHPEWIDFPREGNGWSYQYARRQWSLEDNDRLRYRFLAAFDRAMIALARKVSLPDAPPAHPLNLDEKNQVMVFERGNLIFVFNWSGSKAITDYLFPAPRRGEYRVVLDSDAPEFGGFGRLDHTITHFTDEKQRLSLYLLPRTVLVLEHLSKGGMIR